MRPSCTACPARLREADLVGRFLDDRAKARGELRLGRSLEIIGRGGLAAGEDPFRVLQGHLAHRVDEQCFGFGDRELCSAVHRHDELVGLALHTGVAQRGLDALERRRQRDFHFRIVEKTAFGAELGNRCRGTIGQRLFQTRRRLAVADAVEPGRRECGAGDTADKARQKNKDSAHTFFL
jgi:hypothetical protein